MHTLMHAELARAQVAELTSLAERSRPERPLREARKRRPRRFALGLFLRRPAATGS